MLAAVLALTLVGVAGAANSASFTDPSGDAGDGADAAPDLTNVTVSSDDAGTLTFHVTIANRTVTLNPDDELIVALDLDQNPDTGSLWYGTEVGLAIEGASVEFLRVDSANKYMTRATPPVSFHGGLSNGVATFTVKAADLGLSPTSGFNLAVLDDGDGGADTAPDIRTFNYQQVPGTAPPALGPDTRAPYTETYAARGKRGKPVELDVVSADGRGVTADTFRVYAGKRVIWTKHYALADKNPWFYYYAFWKAPKKRPKGALRFCVTATDAAGNKSNVSCSRILLS